MNMNFIGLVNFTSRSNLYASSSSDPRVVLFFIFVIIICGLVWCILSFIKSLIKDIDSKVIRKVPYGELNKFLILGNINTEENFNDRAIKSYIKVKESLKKRNKKLCESYVSENFYKNHERRINDLIENKKINVLNDINIGSCRITRISKSRNIDDCFIEVKIRGYMFDYWMKEDKTHISGSKNKTKGISDNCRFIIKNNKWVLDDISKNYI